MKECCLSLLFVPYHFFFVRVAFFIYFCMLFPHSLFILLVVVVSLLLTLSFYVGNFLPAETGRLLSPIRSHHLIGSVWSLMPQVWFHSALWRNRQRQVELQLAKKLLIFICRWAEHQRVRRECEWREWFAKTFFPGVLTSMLWVVYLVDLGVLFTEDLPGTRTGMCTTFFLLRSFFPLSQFFAAICMWFGMQVCIVLSTFLSNGNLQLHRFHRCSWVNPF